MAQAGQLQFGVDETYLSNSVSRALIKGVNEAKRSGGALTPNINEQAWRMPLGRITGDVDKFKSSLNAANQRVIAFSASASVFYGISTALKGLVTSTISVNKNMTDLNAIFKLSVADLNKFKNELFDVARSTGQAIDTVSKSSIEFSRQGLGVTETLKRTRDALILTRLTGLDAAEAANTLTAAVNSFSKSGLNTTEILNKMVAADSAFAVSSKDIADALTRVGSSAQDAGVQFNELVALITTTKQVTGRDGAVIGNALKTLLARQDRGTVIETLEKLGVTVRDASSNVLPYISVLKNLAKQYDTLGISQKQQVSQLLGGVYQSNILKALMGDLAKSNSVYEQSLNAVGKAQDEAIKRNEYLNSSLSTTLENLKTTFTQIGSNLGENVLNKNIKSIGSGINTVFGKEFSDSFMNGLKGVDSEGAGHFIGNGLIKGISNVFGVNGGIPGAGLLAIGATLFKVISSTLGTALKDMQNLLSFNEKSLAIQQGIDKAILGANSAEQTRLMTAKTLADQEQVILDILLRQKAAMDKMAIEKNALRVDVISNNPILAKEAYRAGKNAAGGLLPSVIAESHAISKGVGGASSSAKPVVIPNFNFGGGKTGPIVANTDEYLVKNYAGSGSAIFNKQMILKYGMPSGAVKVAADGHIPNFSAYYHGTSKDVLFENQKSGFLNFKPQQRGIFFTSDPSAASTYAMENESMGYDKNRLSRVITANINPQNIYNLTEQELQEYRFTKSYAKWQREKGIWAKYKGYDAINYGGGILSYLGDIKNIKPLFAASGFTPLNIENQYGSIGGILRDKQFEINGITTAQKGMGYSAKLYQELVGLLGERGAQSIKGMLVPQASFNQDLKAILPQLIRGRFGKSNTLRFFNEYEEFGPTLGLKGGSGFDSDLGGQASRIKYLLNSGFGSLPEFTTHLAGGHIPNFARRGRPSIKGPQIRYEGPMDFSEMLGPKGLLELFTIFGFDLGKSPSKSTIDQRTLKAAGIKIPEGLIPGSKFPYRNFANGGIPNSITKAIDRELKAGAPLSSIYVDSDPRLISPKNPRGILVANRRDEPAGGFEGVNKYRELGLDPKAAGASHVPNFADPSELILKYLLKGNQPTSILGNIAYPGSTASVADAQKSVEKELAKIVKGINIKDVDFLSGSQNISKTLQAKIKSAVEKSFSGVEFGKTSAFTKLSDEVLASRQKEISGLTQYQKAIKQTEIINKQREEYEKRVGLSNIGSKIISTSSRLLSPEALAAAQTRSQAQYSLYANSQMATKTPQELYVSELKLAMKESNASVKRLVAANEIQQKLTSGVKYGQLTGLEQITLQKQFQQQAFRNLGFSGTGLTLEQTLRNKEARQQIAQYTNREIAAISERPTFGTKVSKWAGRINNAALPLAFGAPMLAGFIPEGQGGTTAGRTAGGFSGALQGVGSGAAIGMSFGPYGAAIGAGVGAIAGAISGVASKWNKSFEEIGREIETANAKNQQVISNIQLYVQQADQVTELIKSGASQKRIKELIDSQVKLFSSFDNSKIRQLMLSGDISGASSIAMQQQQRGLGAANVTSAISRSVGEVSGFTRAFTGAGRYVESYLPSFLRDESINRPDRFGTVSSKNLQAIAKTLADASDGIKTETDLREFLVAADKDALKAISDFTEKLGQTAESVEGFKELRPNEIKDLFGYFKTFKTERINLIEKATPEIYEQQKRFQLSQSKWDKASLALNLRSSNMRIRGESGIRQQGVIQGAMLDLNPNLTDIERVARSGRIQESALRQSNALNFSVQALQSQQQIAGLSVNQKNSTSIENLMKSIDLFADVGKTGDISKIQEKINQLTQDYESSINTLENSSKEQKDSNDEQAQMTRQQLDLMKDQLLKWNELIESNKAQEQELKLSNSLNIIRTKEQQRQTFLNQANFSSETFAQARRASEAAGGSVFLPGRYKRGNRLQAILGEQDLYSGMGIAQTEQSLTYSNEVKNLRSKETLSRLLSDKLGRKVSSSDVDLTSAAQDLQSSRLQSNRVLGGRVLETLDLQKFDYQTAIKDLTKESGFSQENLAKIMQATGADPVQNIIASNTGATKDSLNSIRDLISGYIDSRKKYEDITDVRKNIASLTERRESLKTELLKTPSVKIQDVEKSGWWQAGYAYSPQTAFGEERRTGINYTDVKGVRTSIVSDEYKKMSDEIDQITIEIEKSKEKLQGLTNPVKNIPPVGASTTAVGTTNIAGTAAVIAESEESIKDGTMAIDEQTEAVDKLTDTWSGFKSGIEKATEKIMTFQELGEKAGETIANSFGTAFGEFVTGSMNSAQAFRSFASSVIADIAKMYATEAMKGVISNLFGFGNSGTASFGGMQQNTGGSILKFATGGKVPALLTGGEFYFTPSQASSIGQNRLHAINSGTAKFARGGLVSGGSGYMDDVPAMLDNGGFVIKRSAVQKYGASNLSNLGNSGIAMFASGGNVSPTMVSGGSGNSGGNTSVKIDIHDNRTSASATTDNSVNDPEFNRKLSIAVKSTVLQTVQEQRRIGGVLRQSKNY